MTDVEQEKQGSPEVAGSPLVGRAAVITGASSGIGQATARAFAAAGAKVGLAARRAERLEGLRGEIARNGGGAEALPLPTDVTDYAQAEEMVRRAEETFGGVDILVNCAGVMHPAPIVRADPGDWRQMVEVNLLGTLYACRAALPGMKERGSGTIINVSSTSGRVASPNFSVYCATKFGLGAFTEVLRKEAHPDVRVILFEPGPTDSELAGNISDPEIREWAREYMEGMHALRAEDVAEALLFVCTRPERIAVSEMLFRPTDQRDW